jgi:hypothetical protein
LLLALSEFFLARCARGTHLPGAAEFQSRYVALKFFSDRRWFIDWAMVAAIGEVGGAMAVVFSLVYVGRQIRQNTAAVKSNVLLGLSRGSMDLALEGGRPPMTGAMLKAVGDHAAPLQVVGVEFGLTPEEALRVTFYFIAMLRNAENRWRQSELGVLDASFDQFGGETSAYHSPVFRAFWPVLRVELASDFADFWERRHGLGSASTQGLTGPAT